MLGSEWDNCWQYAIFSKMKLQVSLGLFELDESSQFTGPRKQLIEFYALWPIGVRL